jgi:PKD repeat protein
VGFSGKVFTKKAVVNDFAPRQGEVGTLVQIYGRNFKDARVFFDEVEARIVTSKTNQITAIVPRVKGEHSIRVKQGSFVASIQDTFFVLSSKAFTFSGDLIFHKTSVLNSVKPSSRELDYLVLIVLPKNIDFPAEVTMDGLRNDLSAKLNMANNFWQEASYKKRHAFTFDIQSQVLKLEKNASYYFRESRTKIESAAKSFSVAFSGEILIIRGDNFEVTVTLKGDLNIQKIKDLINNSIADAGGKEIIFAFSKKEGTEDILILSAAVPGPDAKLEIEGTALQKLGLDEGNAKKTLGAEVVYNQLKLIKDALEKFVEDKSDDEAKKIIGHYSGVIVTIASMAAYYLNQDYLCRPQGDVARQFNLRSVRSEPPLCFELAFIVASTAEEWHTFAHEMGHNLDFPDLYHEPGSKEWTGVLPDDWDIMCFGNDAHPTAWIKSQMTKDPDDHEKTWIQDSEIIELNPASDTEPSFVEVLLMPYEVPPPSSAIFEKFKKSHPGLELKRVIKINVGPNRCLFIENRQRGPTSCPGFGDISYNKDIPASGVIVTDTINSTPLSGQVRSNVLMATDYKNPLDVLNEEKTVLQLSSTSAIRVKITEVYGASLHLKTCVYKVLATWEAGNYSDPYIRPWNAPPYDTPDIWVDTPEWDEGGKPIWDEYEYSDINVNPNVPGNPSQNGDRLRKNCESRFYAQIWNSGNQATSVDVDFFKVVPPGVGVAGELIGTASVNLPAGPGQSARAWIPWTPKSRYEEHLCIRAVIKPQPENDHIPDNNEAQENFFQWFIEGASPYQSVRFAFQIANPLNRRSLISIKARGLKRGWYLDVDPAEFWLDPGKIQVGTAIVRAESNVPFEDIDPIIGRPIISLVGQVLREDYWVPFGGISGAAHAVRKSKIEGAAVPYDKSSIMITGVASTNEGPVANVKVTVNVMDSAEGEIFLTCSDTDADGRIQVFVPNPKGFPSTTEFLVDLILSPSPGIGPAETRIKFKLPSPPDANFTASPMDGFAPLNVQFEDTSSGQITDRSWDFGDGKPGSNAAKTSHLYENQGQYTAKLTVSGLSGSSSKSAIINVKVAPPKADFSAHPQTGDKPLSVQFTDNSHGQIANRSWDFGDGKPGNNAPSPSHLYENQGQYTAKLTVSGPSGSSSKSMIIKVKNSVDNGGDIVNRGDIT